MVANIPSRVGTLPWLRSKENPRSSSSREGGSCIFQCQT